MQSYTINKVFCEDIITVICVQNDDRSKYNAKYK